MTDDRDRRAALLRESLFLIAAQCERRPRPRRLMRLLKRAEPELFAEFVAEESLHDEMRLMDFLLANEVWDTKRLEIGTEGNGQ